MKKLFYEYVNLIIAFILGALIAFTVQHFIVERIKIEGQSMEPTFQTEDTVLIEKLIYKNKSPKIGDIVILKNGEHPLIKRIVGLGGDAIEIKDGILIRNGKEIREEYIKEEMVGEFPLVEVPEGHIFVLGDNRNNSSDSRYFGTFPFEYIIGRVFFETTLGSDFGKRY